MPDISFYLKDDMYKIFKKQTLKKKQEVNDKGRQVIYGELKKIAAEAKSKK